MFTCVYIGSMNCVMSMPRVWYVPTFGSKTAAAVEGRHGSLVRTHQESFHRSVTCTMGQCLHRRRVHSCCTYTQHSSMDGGFVVGMNGGQGSYVYRCGSRGVYRLSCRGAGGIGASDGDEEDHDDDESSRRTRSSEWGRHEGINSAKVQQGEETTAAVGIVVVDHGSKRASANDMLGKFVELLENNIREGRGNVVAVEEAHMELATPSIADAVGCCVDKGATMVVVAPYFLSHGRHIQEDIPRLVEEAQKKFPNVSCVVAEQIGLDARVADVVWSRVEEALQDVC